MASTPALIGPKSCEGASPFRRALREQRRVGREEGREYTLARFYLVVQFSILRLREINEHPFSRRLLVILALRTPYVYMHG
jgi:hypothetical protein